MEIAKNFTERLFLSASRALPIPAAEVARNAHGILYLKWHCPCQEIGALWVSLKPTEITLSCNVAHTHFSSSRYLKLKLTTLQLKRRIVRAAAREVALFLSGKISVTISYTGAGTKQSSGWCATGQLGSSLVHSRKVFGPDITQRAWSWNGPVVQNC